MLEKKANNLLLLAGILAFLIVIFGQNAFSFNSDERKYFYYFGESISMFLIASYLVRVKKTPLTYFWFWFSFGFLLNRSGIFALLGVNYDAVTFGTWKTWEILITLTGLIYSFYYDRKANKVTGE